MSEIDNPIGIIVGEQLSAVTFVMDYVQLSFNGYGLTAITQPVVRVGTASVEWGQAGYRDTLCERITHIVRTASIVEGEEISIVFDDGSSIMVSLRQEDLRGYSAEAATFEYDDHLWVW
jgi:hypothetical protein